MSSSIEEDLKTFIDSTVVEGVECRLKTFKLAVRLLNRVPSARVVVMTHFSQLFVRSVTRHIDYITVSHHFA
jgi:hypothetical protein